MENISDDINYDKLNPALMEEMIVFARDIGPLLDGASAQLDEGLKSLPELIGLIRDIESRVKNSTTEIMDKIESISVILRNVPEQLSRFSVNYDNLLPGAVNLLESFKKKEFKDTDFVEFISKIDILLESFKVQAQIRQKDKEIITGLEDIINRVNSEATSVMVSLQFQDILISRLRGMKSRLDDLGGKIYEINSSLEKAKSLSSNEIENFLT